jgi:integrase
MSKARGLGGIFHRRYGPAPTPGEPDNRPVHYWVTYMVHGERKREPARPNTERAAVALLKRRLGEIASGRFIGQAAERVRFDDLVKALTDDYKANNRRTLKRALQCVAHLRETFGQLAAVQVTRARVHGYVVARLAEGRAPNTVQNEVNTLSRMLALAVRNDMLAAAPRFERLRVSNTRATAFTDEELARLLAVLEHGCEPSPVHPGLRPQPGLAAAATFAAWCGWRLPSDVLGLRWADVNWQAGVVVRPSRGTSKAHTALNWPLNAAPEVRALFERQRAQKASDIAEWVFTREDGRPIRDYRRAFGLACKAVGLTGRRGHDLRRTAARRLRALGLSDRDIAEVCGWRTVAMVSRYLGVDPAGVAARLTAAVAKGTGTFRARLPDAAEAGAR